MNPSGLVRSSVLQLAAWLALGAFVLPVTAEGQQGKGRDRERSRGDVAAQFKPPPGMCRIWIEGVPGSRQPAPTDCGTALRNRPPNGRVIFGDELPRINNSRPAQKGGRRSGK